MFKTNINIALLCFIAFTSSQAQSVDYDRIGFKYTIVPSTPELKMYKTFDITFKNEIESFWGNSKAEELNFRPAFATLRQVETSEDLHVYCTLYSFKQKVDANKNIVYDIDLHSVVANKYGTKVYENHFVQNGVPYKASDKNVKYGVKYYCIEQAISYSLVGFDREANGYTPTLETKLAKLDGVKKKTDLYEFIDQVKLLTPALQKSPSDFVKAAEEYVPFWEKMTKYSEGKTPTEVQRAAYQNLAVYYMFAKDNDKFEEILTEYKKIDKTVKQLFGLISEKNSELLENIMAQITVEPVPFDEKKGGTVVLAKKDILDRMIYKTIDGTVKIKGGKKIAGTYTGAIKIKNVASVGASSGGMLNLDATDISMMICTRKATGEPDTIRTYISNIEELKDKDGKVYVAQKFNGGAVGILASGSAGSYVLLAPSFESAKVKVFRCVVPSSNSGDFIVRKTGDDKGVRSGSLFDFRKVTEYFSDCAEIAADVKSGKIKRSTTPEKIAEQYSNCPK